MRRREGGRDSQTHYLSVGREKLTKSKAGTFKVYSGNTEDFGLVRKLIQGKFDITLER